jgi:hypothetical protein
VRATWWLPALVAAGAFLLAAGLVWLTTYGLPDYVNRLLIKRAVRRYKEIEGIDAWVADARGHLTDADVLARVTWMHDRGVRRLKAQRAELRASARKLPESDLRCAAEREADATPAPAGDLREPNGELAISHAERVLELVNGALAMIDAFDTAVAKLEPRLPEQRREEATKLIASKKLHLATLSESNGEQVNAQLLLAIRQLEVWTSNPPASARPGVRRAVRRSDDPERRGSPPAGVARRGRHGRGRANRRGGAARDRPADGARDAHRPVGELRAQTRLRDDVGLRRARAQRGGLFRRDRRRRRRAAIPHPRTLARMRRSLPATSAGEDRRMASGEPLCSLLGPCELGWPA